MRTNAIQLAALSIALAAGTAIAAEPTPPANPLGGPTQQTDSAIERSQEAREGFGMRRSQFRQANQQHLMGAALRALNEAADQALHLSDEQRKALDDLRAEFESAAREFREENAKELQAMQQKARELRQALQSGDQAAQQAMAEVREQMQAIRENAPKFADIRANIEQVLSEDQLEFVRGAMAQLLEEAQRRGRRGQMGGPLEGMGIDGERPMRPGAGEGRPTDRANERAPEGAAQLRQLAMRLQNLPEDQRQRITELLEAMIAQVEVDNGIDPEAAQARPGGDGQQRQRRGAGRRGGQRNNQTDDGGA